MSRRRLLASLWAVSLILAQALPAAAAGQPGGAGAALPAARVQAGLADDLRAGRLDGFVVEFAATADLRAAARIADRTARGQAVLDALRGTAAGSQGAAKALARGTKGIHATSYWLTNVLVVRATVPRGSTPSQAVGARLAVLAEKLAKVQGATVLRAERTYAVIEPVKAAGPAPQAEPGAFAPEWGVDKIRAPEAWDLGITGSGVVVASIDTGVDYAHEALVGQYRGNNGDGSFTHDYNWWDPTGICGDVPCDNAGHGTHTMGTIVGGDLDGPLPDIGVAPGARWISAKGCADFGCFESDLLSSGQFMVAPTDLAGENPDPAKRPDLVSNSWGSDDPNDTFYLETVQAWRAAGIIPVFAAGNAGPSCGSAGTPGNLAEVISAGATDIDDVIAPFSSRGPSPTDKISPNVSAPGVDVVSSIPGGGYAAASGTSMATPHVAGTIALMISSETALAGNFDAILDALNQTAVDRPDDQCGAIDEDLDPNFVYGEGRIDAKAAVDLVKTGGTLTGTITDDTTGDPIAGARVTADDGSRQFSTLSRSDGTYELFLAAGTYAVSATAFGYAPNAVLGVVIVTDETTVQDLALTALPRFTVSGTVAKAESGAPFEGASVVAVGTPVAPAVSDASGRYALILPIGAYTLVASANGCTDTASADIESAGDDVTADFFLTRKLDGFGHACRAIAFDWVDAPYQTALLGDEFAGRLHLPFAFPFYGESYETLFISDNGYLNFLQPEQGFFFPSGIPSASPPNGAIYPLWSDLVVDLKGAIDYGTISDGGLDGFVIEYTDVRPFGGSARLSFEVKLWSDGTIDLLYGANPASPGDGRTAVVGIEDPTGTDALQIGFFDRFIAPNSALRIETVPVGTVEGTVTDANDGEPIAGATVSATPGHRAVRTGPDGTYRLALLGGFYQVTAAADPYVPETVPAVVTEGFATTIDFTLDAATAVVDPTAISATVEFGETTGATISLANDGSAELVWEARERDLGATLPDLPPAVAGVFTKPVYRAIPLPKGVPLATVNAFDPGSLPIVIDDPDDDSLGPVETLAVRGQSDGVQAAIAIDYSPTTPFGSLGGYIYLDVDQDPSTGLPPAAFFGLPSQDIGFDYFATLFDVVRGVVPVWDLDGNLVAEVAATVDGATLSFAIPLEALGGDDGAIDLAMDNGTTGPEDWAPDVGHGTIESFSDVPWLSEDPTAGSLAPGGQATIDVALGDPLLPPGEYRAQIVLLTNAPKARQVPIDVTLTVLLPDEFGRVTGTISNVHTGAPLAGAVVTVHASWRGFPLDLPATTGGDGNWAVIGPEGTWPTDVVAEGYLGTSIDASIVRGVTTAGADAALHRIQPHATVEAGPLSFILTEGNVGHGSIVVGNPAGHADLEFEIAERGGPVFVAGHEAPPAVAASPGATRTAPAGHVAARVTPSISGNPSLVLMDVLPWDSDAILQVLAANGVPFDVAGSAEIGTIDLFGYQAVYVGNDQPQRFYDAFFGDLARFDDYVAGGGVLWFGASAFGFQDGNLDGAVLPGGLTVHGPLYEDVNRVEAPDHPLMAGMPDPFTGTSASHVVFSDLPSGATLLASGASSGQPTLVEYEHGAGRIIAVGQTVEFAWAFGQDGAILLENAVPYIEEFVPFTDVPWLSVSPTDGSIAPDGSRTLDVTVDTTGLAPGVYNAFVVVSTNDPDLRRVSVPVSVIVPAYRQGINAGGGTYTASDGVVYASDRVYTAGSFGYVGASSARRTGVDIGGTEDDPLYQRLRTGMTAYRFDVPNGVYTVDLRFADFLLRRAGERVFSVSIEGTRVLSAFDVIAEAGGRNLALDRTFSVLVSDGVLDITFVAQRGDKPIVNAILVTHDPLGGG